MVSAYPSIRRAAEMLYGVTDARFEEPALRFDARPLLR